MGVLGAGGTVSNRRWEGWFCPLARPASTGCTGERTGTIPTFAAISCVKAANEFKLIMQGA